MCRGDKGKVGLPFASHNHPWWAVTTMVVMDHQELGDSHLCSALGLGVGNSVQ